MSEHPVTEATMRKPVGMLAIVAIIAIWTVLVVEAAPLIATLHWALQAVTYLLAGIVWILPLGPLLRWMETGRFRD